MRLAPTGRAKRAVLPMMLAGAMVALAACSEVIRNHGYIPLQEDLDGLVVGVDSRGSVEDIIGKPSSSWPDQLGRTTRRLSAKLSFCGPKIFQNFWAPSCDRAASLPA